MKCEDCHQTIPSVVNGLCATCFGKRVTRRNKIRRQINKIASIYPTIKLYDEPTERLVFSIEQIMTEEFRDERRT